MRTTTAVLLGRSIASISKWLKIGGGTAAPGLYALKIQPNLVEQLVRKIPKNIVITGTNGKTTTARMIAHFAKEAGLKVIRNHTGSNLERGIASTLISNSHFRCGKLNFDLGVWELDEAAFNSIAPKLNPDIVVILNVSRDQLDRYGEVDKVVSGWHKTLNKLPKSTTLLINGDDKNLSQLESCFKGKIFKFNSPKDIKLNGLTGSKFSLIMNHESRFNRDKSLIVNLSLPGVYHVYDAVAALTAAQILKLSLKTAVHSLKTFKPAFGRVEKFTMQPSRLQAKVEGFIFLIKNPAGATAVFETIAPQLKENDKLLLALNDGLADGTDVSWIWDAGFEQLLLSSSRAKRGDLPYDIIVSGTRAYDLANRLKYAGLNTNNITVAPDLENAFQEAARDLEGRLFILPTYTAMLSLQGILTKKGLKKHYWREN